MIENTVISATFGCVRSLVTSAKGRCIYKMSWAKSALVVCLIFLFVNCNCRWILLFRFQISYNREVFREENRNFKILGLSVCGVNRVLSYNLAINRPLALIPFGQYSELTLINFV